MDGGGGCNDALVHMAGGISQLCSKLAWSAVGRPGGSLIRKWLNGTAVSLYCRRRRTQRSSAAAVTKALHSWPHAVDAFS